MYRGREGVGWVIGWVGLVGWCIKGVGEVFIIFILFLFVMFHGFMVYGFMAYIFYCTVMMMMVR